MFALLFWVPQSALGMHDFCLGMMAAVNAHAERLRLPHVALREVAERFFGRTNSVRAFSSRPSPTVPVGTKVLSDPREALLARVMAIREAKHTIDLTSYIFEGDEAAYLILGELKDAIARGVSVRLLVDSVGTMRWGHPEIRTLFAVEPGFQLDAEGNATTRRAKVEIGVVNPITGWLMGGRNRLNHRMHDKLLVVDAEYGDRAVAILGGRNIENGYFHFPPDSGAPLRDDMDVLIRAANDDRGPGSLGRRLEAHVNRLMYAPGTRHLIAGLGPFDLSHQRIYERAIRYLDSGTPFGDLLGKMEREGYLKKDLTRTDARLVNDLPNLERHSPTTNPDPRTNPKNARHGDSARDWSIKEIRGAEETIDIVTPYLYLTKEEIQFLRTWVRAKPGRKVRILTNSAVTTDNVLVTSILPDIAKHFFERPGDPTSKRLIELYVRGTEEELGTTPSLMHAKYVVLDGKRVLVTSSNGDPRSRWINSEVGTWYDDPIAAKQLTANTDDLIGRSTLWDSPEYKALRADPRLRWTRAVEFFSRILVKTLRLQPQL